MNNQPMSLACTPHPPPPLPETDLTQLDLGVLDVAGNVWRVVATSSDARHRDSYDMAIA